MIDELHAVDVALIRDATIRPAAGLTVLTGETGAGKTALLGALKLLVGERAEASMVREGARELMVEGRVFLPGGDPDGCIVRRRVGADGRGRVEVDGGMASVRELSATVGSTVDLCGQHEHQRLLSVVTHVDLLDAFAGERAATALAAYREALARAHEAADELDRVRELSRTANEQLDEAQYVLGRIDAVSLREGEYEELEETLPRAEHAEALILASEEARAALSGGDSDAPSAYDLISQAADALHGAGSYDPALERSATALESLLVEVEDASATLRRYRDSVDFDQGALEAMQTRMSQLQGLLRAYGPRIDDVLARRERAAEVVSAAGDEGLLLREAQREVDAAESALARTAGELDEVRRAAAPSLERAITAQMERLSMGSASIEVQIDPLPREQWGSAGPSHVELMYRPGAGLTARPLRKIASGGEVSRVMLAAKVVLGESDAVETLVFDEVDAGVGGSTAVALADVLADLARTHQVIVVTHLAQVAVAAECHYVVEKHEEGGVPETRLVEVTGEDRVREIARMLSGDTGEASLAHAREMLGA
ncbi:MAG: DNA repair protein RecN [Olsenella sp.]|nr:DNA repair protein RecN [Olsenella sp.]